MGAVGGPQGRRVCAAHAADWLDRPFEQAGCEAKRPDRERAILWGATPVPETSSRSIDPMSTVLIIGASRGIGIETVKLALKAGHSVRAMARSASVIRLRDPKLQKLDGDCA